ncbi:MAG: YdcF family protein [Clostridia bacterium]|nr:YdcF family protein [Clostridia bacterium]
MKKRLYITAALLTLTVAAAVTFGSIFPETAAETALAGIFLFLAVIIVSASLSLRDSLRETLYSYRNIALIAGILFSLVMEPSVVYTLVTGRQSGGLTPAFIYRSLTSFPRTFSYYAVFFISAVCILLAVSNIALIRHEGPRPKNALSLVLAAFYLGGTWAVYAVSDVIEKKIFTGGDPLPRILNSVIPLFLLLMLCYFECIFVGFVVMGWLAAREKPVYDKDFIIILGCSIDKKGGLLPLLKGRVNRAIRFAWQQEIATGKPLKYVPSGGKGANEVMSEGSAMELYLLSHGAEDYEVFPEKKSADTLENFRFSKEIIDSLKPDAKIAFATTNYHMLRSGILARKVGIDAEGVAGDTKWYFWPNGFIREFFGILKLDVKAHVTTAAIFAVICTALGFIEFYLY